MYYFYETSKVMKCNACRRDLTGFEAVATACNHTFCKDCAGRILNQSEPCPVCTAVLTEGDFHTIRVGAAAEQCKYFLYGQTTEEILKAANYAIRFYNEQEFIQCVWKEESLVHSKNEMKQKAMTKIKDVYNAYLREREHVKRLKEERQLLERDKEELREKYNEKSRQKRRLEEMVTHNSNPTTPQNNQQLAHPVYPQAPPNGWGNVDRGNNYGPHPGQTGRVHLQQQSSVRVQYQTPNFANEGNRGRLTKRNFSM